MNFDTSNTECGSTVPQLSVVIPVYNEERLLGACVEHMLASLQALSLPAEIILVNDGSRDKSGQIADGLATKHPGVVRVKHQENQGIGGAFRTGLLTSRGESCMLWPADMIASPASLQPFAQALGQADVLVGCRRRRLGYNPLMRLNASLYPKLVGLLFELKLRDVNWICVYPTKRLRALPLTQRGIPMLTEILVRLRDSDSSFRELDVDMQARAEGIPSARRFRVMYRTLRGLLSFWRQWKQESRQGL